MYADYDRKFQAGALGQEPLSIHSANNRALQILEWLEVRLVTMPASLTAELGLSSLLLLGQFSNFDTITPM